MRGKVVAPALVAALAFGSCVVVDAPHAVAAGVISPSTLATARAHVGDPYQAALSFSGSPTWTVARRQAAARTRAQRGHHRRRPDAGRRVHVQRARQGRRHERDEGLHDLRVTADVDGLRRPGAPGARAAGGRRATRVVQPDRRSLERDRDHPARSGRRRRQRPARVAQGQRDRRREDVQLRRPTNR